MERSAMWPEGKGFAVAFTFDFDAEEGIIGDDPANADRPGVLSQGTYGAKVAVPLILDLLADKRLTATFFIPGRVAERHPQRVEAIVAAGHEIAHHGYTHTSPTSLGRDEEDLELAKGLEVLRSFNTEVTGYRSPAWDFSANTEELLERHGFVYSSNFMDDLRPYRHERSSLVELPIQWTLDDAAQFWFDADSWNKKISTAEEVRSIWEGELRGYRRLGGA
ncbi:MAG TPA: polysaccharide deacetylase family protein, partial [Actinomycetota bacterium]|nr:polysaccharide deacetylase family protein [Actinomycetota bacterium]